MELHCITTLMMRVKQLLTTLKETPNIGLIMVHLQ